MKRTLLVLLAATLILAVAQAVRAAGSAATPVAAAVTETSGNGAMASLDFRQVIKNAKDKVFPAVVYIRVLQESHESGRKISFEVSGSGVIISAKGEVLTNWHVIDKATEVRCLLYDGRAMDAKVVGSDKDTDLAVLQLDTKKTPGEVPFAAMGDSEILKEGDFVMAMGAPWGMSRSVSMGIIACSRRFLPERSQYSLWLQTDASISPGNSGGPLVNTAGEVVGINSLGVTQGGDMGFAVPASTIQNVVAQIREFGRMNWSWTGLQLQPLRDFDRNTYFEGKEGVNVAETDIESPARRAGIKAGDRIMKIGGTPVTAMTQEDLPAIRRMLGLLPKNKAVAFDLVREGKPLSITFEPREKGKVEGEELDCPRWDFTAKQINQFDNPDLFFYRDKGVFIFGVKEPGNAAIAGLRPHDIVIKIEGKDVTTLEDIKAAHKTAIDGIETKHRLTLTVLRNGMQRQIVLDFSRDFSKE
jgi:serine protease Do